MPDEKQKPSKTKVHARITRVAGVCNAWCLEWRMYDRWLPTAFLTGVLIFLFYFVTLSAPLDFPSGSLLKIEKGKSTINIAKDLKSHHIVRSALIFWLIAKLYGGAHAVVAGEYFFPGEENVFTVARRLSSGDYELTPVKVTIPEGATARNIQELLEQKIADFDSKMFLETAQPKEGYLFPDTYFFLPGVDPQEVVYALLENFKNKTTIPEVKNAITTFNKPLSDVVIMASLLEKEAPKIKDKRIVAGILWNRIAIGMPLQVDAVFPYIIGVNSLQLTREQLKTDSPYNTYLHKGLPPGPIANPGLDSIIAAVTPTKTNYVFYLSDMQGNFHFCVTYACQLANQRRYLP